METLDNIYAKHGTDKGNKVDRYGNGHHYGDFYEPFFEKYKGRSVKMLEIGVQHGYSMLSHNEYFGGNAELWGIDITLDSIEFKTDEHPNMNLVLGSSTDPLVYSKVADTKFDIIIDDGSHFHEDMVKNLSMYSKLLAECGLYIIEDLHCDFDTYFNDGSDSLVLNMILRHVPSKLLTEEENNRLLSSIQQVFVYEYVNKSSAVLEDPCTGSSITAIVKFKN